MIKFKIDLFNHNVVYIKNKKQYHKFIKSKKNRNLISAISFDYEEDSYGFCYTSGNTSYLVIFDNRISTLCHESLHVVQAIKERSGMCCNETEAYILHYILEKILDSKKNKLN